MSTFIEVTGAEGRVAVNTQQVLYVSGADGGTLFHFGTLHGTFVEVAESFEVVMQMLSPPLAAAPEPETESIGSVLHPETIASRPQRVSSSADGAPLGVTGP